MAKRSVVVRSLLVAGLGGLSAAGVISAAPTPTSQASVVIDPAIGIYNLEHLIFVVQENRSFDHYFGTFPGANGLPRDSKGRIKVCLPDPRSHTCRKPYHDKNVFDLGGPHGERASAVDVNGGRMDGFIRSIRSMPRGNGCKLQPNHQACHRARPGPFGQPDVMGYHTRREIPNYWRYAKTYTLQDRMFAPTDSWTLPAHLYLVSAWSAYCPQPANPMSCRTDLSMKHHWVPADGAPRPFGWADITWLLHANHVSWRYYVGPGTCNVPGCPKSNKPATIPIQNPLPGFRTVERNGQLGNITSNAKYFAAAKTGTLPAVSWVMPTQDVSEHPPDSIRKGQAWVTKVVNAITNGPLDQWLTTAIFITWDDWGGFYDHVKPIRIDRNGYGIRVPGILISAFSKGGGNGFIDHQTLSFDAYLKLIEDRFLGGQRLDPRTDGWPDARPFVRERADRLGNLAREFDFTQEPLPRLILDPTPS